MLESSSACKFKLQERLSRDAQPCEIAKVSRAKKVSEQESDAKQNRKPPPKELLSMPIRLQELIDEKGWSQADLARAVEINSGHINGLFTGKRVGGVQAAMALHLADKLEVNVLWLLTGKGPKRGPAQLVFTEGTPEYDRVLAVIRDGDPESR